jgi:hypothetical protein
VKELDERALLTLLRIYEAALHELEEMSDSSVAGLMQRLEGRRLQVITALGARRDMRDV